MVPRTAQRDRDDGFSLIEVSIAVLILSSALATLATLLPRALDATRLSRDRFLATTIARQKVEALARAPAVPLPASGADIVEAGAAGSFVRRWRVEPAAGGLPNLLAIRVDVQRQPVVAGADPTLIQTVSTTVR